MVQYKLYYFNVTGLGEPIRYILNYCGVDFEDIRIKDFEEWTEKYKNIMPMDQVPVLEIDGVKYHQHIFICRYIAEKFNLCGSNSEESLKIDALVGDINDMRLFIAHYYNEKDAYMKEKFKERMLEKLPFFLDKFASQALKNDGYFFNNKITWADIYYAGMCEVMSNILEYDINKNHPSLKKLTDNVRNNERIKTYRENRPITIL